MSRTLVFPFAVCGLILFAPAAKAEGTDWPVVQFQGIVGGEAALTDHVAVRASVNYFWVPRSDIELLFTYAGPKFTIADWFWTAPQIGSWFNSEDDGLVLSLWNGLTFGNFTAFLEVDEYFSPGYDPNLYGYCSLDANSSGTVPANFGLQFEEIETDFTFGPHLGFTKGPAHFEAQYYISGPTTPLQTNMVRFLTSINF